MYLHFFPKIASSVSAKFIVIKYLWGTYYVLDTLGIKQGMRPRVEDGGWKSTGMKGVDNNVITVVVKCS